MDRIQFGLFVNILILFLLTDVVANPMLIQPDLADAVPYEPKISVRKCPSCSEQLPSKNARNGRAFSILTDRAGG